MTNTVAMAPVAPAPHFAVKSTFDNDLVENLISLVDDVIKTTTDTASREASIPLFGLITASLQLKRDQELEAALEILSDREVNEGFYTFQRCIESVIERLAFGSKASTLFVIPVVCVMPKMTASHSGMLQVTEDMTRVAQAFKEISLVSAKGMVGLIPYLYHPGELADLSYVETYSLHEKAVLGAVHRTNVNGGEMGQLGWPASPAGTEIEQYLAVRYLVGFTLDDADNPVLYDDRPHADQETYVQKLSQFIEKATDPVTRLVRQHYEESQCMVEVPQLYFEGRRAGLVEAAQVSLDAALAASLAEANVTPRGALAIISPLVVDEELRGVEVTALSRMTGDILCTHSRPVYGFEDLQALLTTLPERLVKLSGFFDSEVWDMSPAAQLMAPKEASTPVAKHLH